MYVSMYVCKGGGETLTSLRGFLLPCAHYSLIIVAAQRSSYKKHVTSMSSKPEPAILTRDTGQLDLI